MSDEAKVGSGLSGGLGGADPMRDAFEKLVKQWTGRDMVYHYQAGTTGLEFAWFCFQAGATHEREKNNPKLSGGLGEAEFEVRCNGEAVAWATGKRDEAKREAEHYAFIYGQDGPVEVFEVFKTYTRMDYTRW